MIAQIMGHISYKQLLTEEYDTDPLVNFAYRPQYVETTKVHDELQASHRAARKSYHHPKITRSLPKPNSSIPMFENSPHVWHFYEMQTGIEFLVYSDGRRKNHYKGTSIEVMLNGNEKDDSKLAHAYKELIEYMFACHAATM
jgi:hypothetical protein